MSQRDPQKLMFWGGENIDEVVLNQGRRGLGAGSRKQSSMNLAMSLGQPGAAAMSKAVMRRQSMRRMSGLVDLSKSKEPLFEFRVLGGKPLVSLATFFHVRVSGIGGPLTITLKHHRGLISSLLEPFHRFFISINGHDGKLNIFKDRKTATPVLAVVLGNAVDMSFVVDGQLSHEEGSKNSQTDVVLHFSSGEKLYFRTPDHGDRRALQYIFLRLLGRDKGWSTLVNRPKRASSAAADADAGMFQSLFGRK
jgi:hypothetical protein